METVIRFVMENFTLTFLVMGLIAAGISLWAGSGALTLSRIVEALFSCYLMFAIGFTFLYNFIMHVFFADMSARFIGWDPSPFQMEVGMASLGFAAVGFLAFRGSFGLRIAAVVGPAVFLWGAAIGHVQQMIVAGNFEPGNAGIIFYTDIAVPVAGFVLLWLQYRSRAKQ